MTACAAPVDKLQHSMIEKSFDGAYRWCLTAAKRSASCSLASVALHVIALSVSLEMHMQHPCKARICSRRYHATCATSASIMASALEH